MHNITVPLSLKTVIESPFFSNMQYKNGCVRFTLKFTGAVLLQFFSFIYVIAQQDTSVLKFELCIPANYNLSSFSSDADRLAALMSASPVASQSLSGVNVLSFHPLYPGSHYQYLRNIYQLTCINQPSALSAVLSLHMADAASFQYVKQAHIIAPLGSYTPNDYNGVSTSNPGAQLDYINAKTAWGVTKGNPAITIGINDPSGFDVNNPDLKQQIIGIGHNRPDFHGTAVAGCVAARTDNGIGVASIGFNCSLYVDDRGGDDVSLSMSAMGLRVINNSWFYGFDCTPTLQPTGFVSDQLVYDEVYENGTSTCFAAGNGLSGFGHCPSLFSYAYPASLDHIITVGAVGFQNPLGTFANWSPTTFPPGGIPWMWKDCHEESPGNAIGQFGTLNYEANERVDISAPAYNVSTTSYSPTDSSQHYISYACGTSFASPIVAGTLGLMLSANTRLSPYQLEYLLKTNARNIDYVEYPTGSGINLNEYYVGKMGAGALDAGAAVVASAAFNTNDTGTQTMYIDGIELNTICAPGFSSNGINPTFYPVIENGTPPYTYRWDPLPGNNTTLSDYTSPTPVIVSGTFAQYRLAVYDHSSAVPKEASRIIQLKLTTAQTPVLTLRDSYMDMLNEPNTQADVDGYDWQYWLSPDIVNRLLDDHTFTNQNPVYNASTPNYANARIRNVGCTASSGNETLNLYWTKTSTGEAWPADWTTNQFINPTTGNRLPMGGLINSSPINIPVIQPGGESLQSAAWYPPNPENYDATTNTVDISLLGRIVTASTFPYGITIPEVVNTADNIVNNNKIAARRLIVNNATGGEVQWHQVIISNTGDYLRVFKLEFGSEKQFHPSLAGDISAYLKVEVELGDLFDRWVQGQNQGENILVDGKNKSVIFTGEDKLVLKGLAFNPHETFLVKVGIILTQQPLKNQFFHIRQSADSLGTPTIPYGDVTFLIPGCSGDTSCTSPAPNFANTSLASRVNVFPNPTSGLLTILYSGFDENTLSYSLTNLWGQKLFQQNGTNVVLGAENSLDISGLSDGVYILKLTERDNNSTTVKIVKD